MKKVEIVQTGLGTWSIKVDGHEIADAVRRGSASLDLGGDADIPVLSVDLVAYPASVDAPDALVRLPDATRDALVALGWTPPEADA